MDLTVEGKYYKTYLTRAHIWNMDTGGFESFLQLLIWFFLWNWSFHAIGVSWLDALEDCSPRV